MTDFTGAMGYCEFQIPFFIEGIKVETVEMLKGIEHHEEAERIERETVIPVPLTRTKLEDKKADLNFMREDIQTSFAQEFDFPQGSSRLTLSGRADKVIRDKGTLIVSDDKRVSNPSRYDAMPEPYIGQLLQVLTYLNSRYYLGSSFGGWAEIPHVQKRYQINIVDSKTRSVYKTYEDNVTRRHLELLFDYALRFTKKCLQLDALTHHNSKARCKACGFFNDCSRALR
ncbi:MAG: hypothetical protein ACREBI_02895 [Nitrosotalea sp.]